MHIFRCVFSFQPQFLIENNIFPTPRLTIKERPFRYLNVHHLLKTDCLGAKLNLVAIVYFGFPSLVFNRKRYPRPIIRLVKFDYISLADEIRLPKALEIAGSLGH